MIRVVKNLYVQTESLMMSMSMELSEDLIVMLEMILHLLAETTAL